MQNNTQLRENQKVVENNGKLEVKVYPRNNKQPIQQKPKFISPYCFSCKRKNWLEFDKSYFCRNCENIIKKQKHQIDKEVPIQDHYFSTRLQYADTKKTEINYSMANTTYNSTQDMIINLQQLKGKTKLEFYEKTSNYYDEMKNRRQSGSFQFQEHSFSKTVQGIDKFYHEVLLLMKFLQTKPQAKDNIYYALYYTVIENREDKEIVNDKHEKNELDYFNLGDFITPNPYIGRKIINVILK